MKVEPTTYRPLRIDSNITYLCRLISDDRFTSLAIATIKANPSLINQQCDKLGLFPLQVAILYKNVDIVMVLLTIPGIDLHTKNAAGLSCYDCAMNSSNYIIKDLVASHKSTNSHSLCDYFCAVS